MVEIVETLNKPPYWYTVNTLASRLEEPYKNIELEIAEISDIRKPYVPSYLAREIGIKPNSRIVYIKDREADVGKEFAKYIKSSPDRLRILQQISRVSNSDFYKQIRKNCLTNLEEEIMKILNTNPGISKKELAKETKKPVSVISWTLNSLKDLELISMRKSDIHEENHGRLPFLVYPKYSSI